MKIKFTISSHLGSYTKTYKPLVSSMIESGIPAEDIYFFVGGGSGYERIENEYNVNMYIVDHNSFDLNGLISITDLGLIDEADYWFLLHDTCYVEKHFYKYIKEFKHWDEPSVRLANRLHRNYSMNIGSYSKDWLFGLREQLINFKNQDYSEKALNYWKLRHIDAEDTFFDWDRTTDPYSYCYNSSKMKEGKPVDFYQTGTIRVPYYYEEIGLYKFQANHKTNHKVKLILDL